ncbi:hypothetical protein [Lederbergia galactosidilytica]|uniref:Uncharacterized protein n=1 Tax=Lederbergia galactosidilytica TaxID=217031 RepID=A0A177ZRX8_9BACI|nr:hypothetical protein [Lederbergia galactosidilytica]OAK70050.1 hypothetical protein ABB05_12760 [Lederbergia galactosidilytica]
MLEKEIAKELTIKAIDKMDTKYAANKSSTEKNELIGKEVGIMYKEIFKAVLEANNEIKF